MKTLQNLFLNELADIYDAELRLVDTLPKMAQAATCNELKLVSLAHLEETKGHVAKVEKIFDYFNKEAKRETCEATLGLLREGDEIAADFKGSPALDAALIAIAQKIEHYEIATYGCLRAWATEMGNPRAASLLKEILDEEKGANEALTELAFSSSNEKALGEPADETGSRSLAPNGPAAKAGCYNIN